MRIIPEKDLYPYLMSVKAPGQYVGGEYGITVREQARLTCGLSFPDLYEIGMSNLAVKILYNRLNTVPGVACERVFAPGTDFEELLRSRSIPLYTLETGIPLHELDVLAFTIGYELSATNILSILHAGGVPIQRTARSEHHPIVIAGGPAITNPVPLSRFIDVFFLGESEQVVVDLFADLSSMKASGAGRQDILDRMLREPSSYSPLKTEKTRASVWQGFGNEISQHQLPIPNLKPVQDNGVVEIMRGCPNGCRFCHAGVFYRPFRMKPFSMIEEEIRSLIHTCGYREITLSSLSSGDYTGIVELMRKLNRIHSGDRVSFSLPSLRINSLTFPLLEEIASVRKSGLTFAIETPMESWQRGLNKTVDYENLLELLSHARKNGWKQAKFYFMIGLPVSGDQDDATPIADFLNEIQRRTSMQINANVGTFIPKPHTPFQWARQLSEQESYDKISSIKHSLRSRKIKLGFNAPFQSFLEGILARGDARVGELIEKAYTAGARFDAWEDLIRKPLWKEVIDTAGWDVEKEILSARDPQSETPWESIDLGVKKSTLVTEYNKALSGDLTDSCEYPCSHHCGICTPVLHPETETLSGSDDAETVEPLSTAEDIPAAGKAARTRILFSFSKTGKAVFLSHLNVMSIFERAYVRANLSVSFTEGFNPKPRLEFAQPLSLGYFSEGEVASIFLEAPVAPEDFRNRLNGFLPQGIHIQQVVAVPGAETGKSRKSLMAVYAGSDYRIRNSGKSPGEFALSDVFTAISSVADSVTLLSAEPDHMDIHIPVTVTGGLNGIFKHLDRDIFSSGLTVQRLKMYCSSDSGLRDYFETYQVDP